MMHWTCWSAFAELATKLGEDPIRPGKPALLPAGFVMTDELMLFLAAEGSLLCWWNGGCVKMTAIAIPAPSTASRMIAGKPTQKPIRRSWKASSFSSFSQSQRGEQIQEGPSS